MPKPLQQGLFAAPKTYNAWIRFSNAPPNIQSDKKRSGRGLAIKILDVEGPNLGNDPIGTKTQDFLMTTSPVLSAGHVANYKRAIFALTKGFPHNLGYILTPSNWRRLYLTLKNMKKHADLLEQQYFIPKYNYIYVYRLPYDHPIVYTIQKIFHRILLKV